MQISDRIMRQAATKLKIPANPPYAWLNDIKRGVAIKQLYQ
jgi:hypothetical protein